MSNFKEILLYIYIPICDGYFYVFNQLGWAMMSNTSLHIAAKVCFRYD